MNEEVKQFLTEYNKSKNYGTSEADLIETVREAKEVYRDDGDKHRWWVEYTYVVEIGERYLAFADARSTGDQSASEAGYDFDDSTISFVEPYTKTVTMYK